MADALEQNLAWLPEDRRSELFTHLMRGEYELVLEMLRNGRREYPRVVSIPRAIEVVERAVAAKLLREIGRLSDEIVVGAGAGNELDDSPRSTILRLGRMCATLGELLDRCPQPRLPTLRILRDLTDEGSLVVREPARRATGLRLGDAPKQVRPKPRRG